MEERARDIFIEYMRKRGVEIRKFQFNASLIVLPLQFRAKTWILEELHKHNIYNFTWYCENPHDGIIRNWEKSFKPCNECHSCRTHIMALKEIDKTWTHLELRKLGVK